MGLRQDEIDPVLQAERARRHHEDPGQTLVGVKKLKGMLQVQIPAKYAIPAFTALLGFGGVRQAELWKRGVDQHIEASASGYGRLEAVEKLARGLDTRMERMEQAQREQWYRDAYRSKDYDWMAYLETQDPTLRELRSRLRTMERR